MKRKLLAANIAIILGISSFDFSKASGNEETMILLKEDNLSSPSLRSRMTKPKEKTVHNLSQSLEEKYLKGCKNFNQNKYDVAFNYFSEAAEEGHPGAQYNYALCLEFGVGVKQSRDEAIKWYTYAAANNHVQAIQKIRAFIQSQ